MFHGFHRSRGHSDFISRVRVKFLHGASAETCKNFMKVKFDDFQLLDNCEMLNPNLIQLSANSVSVMGTVDGKTCSLLNKPKIQLLSIRRECRKRVDVTKKYLSRHFTWRTKLSSKKTD